MAPKRPKRPRDPNQLGKLIVDLSTGDAKESAGPIDTPAVAFARLGGLKGGPARSATLSKTQRKQIAKKAAEARWAHRRDTE
jgi:hypothetical protein